MSVIAIPTDLKTWFESAKITLVHNNFEMKSFFSRKRQVISWPGAHEWMMSCKIRPLDEPDAGLMRAFLAKLRGKVNTFQLPVPGYNGPYSEYSGSAGLVVGGSQVGNQLSTDGWSNSTLVLKAGDYFTVNNELKLVTVDATTNGSGAVTLDFEPALRSSPADNAPLTIVNPYCVMSLQDDAGAEWDLTPGFQDPLHGMELKAIEAVA